MEEYFAIRKEPPRRNPKIKGKYLPEFVYGGMNGTITTFIIVSGAVGASLNFTIALILGFVNLFGDGFSMAVSNFLSMRSRNEMLKKPEKNEYKTAIATFLSFIVMGFVPLLSLVLAKFTKNPFIIQNQFGYAFVLTGIALIVIGWYRGNVTRKDKIKSTIQTLIIGLTASILAFVIGKVIRGFFV